MDDLRQKLFPIFLKEAKTNLAALRQFLDHEDLTLASAEELETAFRAAHTLKGTANLVQADSICKIARRLEAMLEKHFSARSRPTLVEQEAMKLSVDWLAPLVSALQGNLQEPKLFVAEALQALDLAEAFPGRTPLVELLDSHAEQRSPDLDDPFASDPDLLADEELILRTERDPFADDPGFGMEIDMMNPAEADLSTDTAAGTLRDDPFFDDQDYSVDILSVNNSDAESADVVERFVGELPYDPFAEDSLGLEGEALSGPPAGENTLALEVPAVTVDTAMPENPLKDEGESSSVTIPVALVDPFAEDDDFIAGLDLRSSEDISSEEGDEVTGGVAERAEEIAASLLLPHEETAPRKDYVCCVFVIGGRDYHLPIKQMQEIADLPEIVPLPLAPPMISGLINLRGQVMPVINLAILNQHQQSEVRVQRRLIIAEHQHESLAFLADGVPYLSEVFSGEKVDMSKFLSLYRVKGGEE